MSETRRTVSASAEKQDRGSTSQIARATQGLRAMLLRGDFRPGQRIAEIPIAAALGVSRSPLRLALEKLEHEGLLTALHPGFAAREFSIDDVWDAIETRGVLEGAAARLAAERVTSLDQLEPLRTLNRRVQEMMRQGIDPFIDQYLGMNTQFHAYLVELAGNQKLRAAIEQVYRYPFAMPTVPGTRSLVPIAQQHHHLILDAIEHREGARAEAIAREHALITWQNLELAMSDASIWPTVPGANLVRFRESIRRGRPASRTREFKENS